MTKPSPFLRAGGVFPAVLNKSTFPDRDRARRKTHTVLVLVVQSNQAQSMVGSSNTTLVLSSPKKNFQTLNFHWTLRAVPTSRLPKRAQSAFRLPELRLAYPVLPLFIRLFPPRSV
jgi:hypothetical protein